MTSDIWRKTTIGEVCEVYDGPHATPTKTQEGPIFLGISNLESGRLNLTEVDHLSEQDFVKWTRRVTPQFNDLVFSYETRLGEAALIPDDLRCCLGRRIGLMRPDTSKVDPRFLLYYYLGPDFQQVIQARKIQGSTVNRIPLTELPSYPIYLPPLPEQRAIAAILGSLDDKIELNRQMNATLEAIACAIFKSWFVDFDSVHAKARGEAPAGMDAATAALFPDGFVESELGPIPAGWEAGKLKQLVKMKNGKRPGKREREQTSELQIPLYGGGGVMGYVEESLYTEPILLTGRVGTLGNVFRVTEPCWPSDNTITIRPRREILYEYVYFVLRHVRFSVLNRGSTQPLIAQKDLKLLPVVIPSNEELRTYHQFARSLFKKVDLNKTESRALAELRDTLLPKLISGELRVPEKMRQD